jgi:hypothetical protein
MLPEGWRSRGARDHSAGARPRARRQRHHGAGKDTASSKRSAQPTLDCHRPMQKAWWEETVHTLVAMDDSKQQKQLEVAIRELVRLAVLRAEFEGYQQGCEDGKRRAVN